LLNEAAAEVTLPAGDQLRLFTFDLNYAVVDGAGEIVVPSAATDWQAIDPTAYIQRQLDAGANLVSCQGWTYSGYALFESELGPRAIGSAATLMPRAFAVAKHLRVPVVTYINVGSDLAVSATRPHWLVPGSQGVEILGDVFPSGFLAPESGWGDLLIERITELLSRFPADWLLLDWFCYGNLVNDLPISMTSLVHDTYRKLIGGPPSDPSGTLNEHEALRYRRAVLANLFGRIQAAAKAASARTKLVFNVPYFRAADPLWADHPMLLESDALFAESSNAEIVDWLLSVRRNEQRVWTTIHGRPDDHVDAQTIQWTDVSSWRHWSERGCDLVAWTFPKPPRAEAHPKDLCAIGEVAAAYRLLAGGRTG
jgi:hypothetical protein